MSITIGPENGTIEALEELYDQMTQFRATWLFKGEGLDKSEEIYRPTSGGVDTGYTLKNPQVEDIFEFEYLLNVDDIISWMEFEEEEIDDDDGDDDGITFGGPDFIPFDDMSKPFLDDENLDDADVAETDLAE